MLTRLELLGFKSFADKTRFDFAAGITAVVGPNGSGKSNIVDAVKWVLGEQSAKALRGGEMADVIFNGSSTRKSLGLAEVTLTFDNRRRQLGTDADEVSITRRVYRDGQGEYLINHQPSRLKDIKELFLGSGAGHGAYSVIEQGRVDALLTASTADRRQIFEEAAGISRFKAKKIETLRKLERVDADLTRARDILQELEKQLRTLRLQAAKAQRFQEYTDQLRDLRVGVGLREFRDLTATLDEEERRLAEQRADLSGVTEREQEEERRSATVESTLAAVEGELRGHEATLNRAKQTIAGCEASVRSERGQCERAEAELLRLGKQRFDLSRRLQAAAEGVQAASADLTAVSADADAEKLRADAAAAILQKVTAHIAALAASSQADVASQFDLARQTTKLQGETEGLRREAERLKKELTAKLVEAERRGQQHDALAGVLDDLGRSDADVQQQLTGARQNLAEHLAYRDDLRRRADALQADLDAARDTRSALRGRADVLEGLERTLDGVGAGVREVIARRSAGSPELAAVVGLVGELLSAPRDVAPLIDLALGDAAQRFVVAAADLDPVAASLTALPGRVGLIPLVPPAPPAADHFDTLTPAASLVSVDRPELAGLPHQLLGHVYIVADLAVARAASARLPHARFVTRHAEVLDADGSLTIGPVGGGGGFLSRKSELRELRAEIRRLDEQVQSIEAQQLAHRRQADAMDAPVQALETEIAALSGTAGTLQSQIAAQRQEQKRLTDLMHLLREEARHLEAESRSAEAALARTHDQWQQAVQQEAEVGERLVNTEAALAAAHADRDRRQKENTDAQVALGAVNARLAALRTKHAELENELKLRRFDAINLTTAERSAAARLAESQLLMLRASDTAAHAYLEKEDAERAAGVLAADRDRLRTERERAAAGLKRLREVWGQQRELMHKREMEVQDLSLRRDAIAARIRDDYAVELADLAAAPPPAGTDDDPVPLLPADPAAVQAQIDDLRKKIAKLGSVNPEAVAELAEVEARETALRTQHDDLTSARDKLLEIITQINTDSRKLFLDTLTTVRGHFQELFRKLFGGGMADVVLDGDDPLEAGIDITARPPGKELRSISLLSGGERTLTAIALLLAVFRSRPSPFCLLDEVDAALDEANTARLATALREFLDRSQFIIITHKKRTMAMADVIFGVTMQESGVSKQVSVRFDDWPEDEEAKQAA
ncbi:MAG: chromosome segregation protein SMC [Fimbriiglobus sp.]|nr:chromosome segregation protein SMC [Fimbriiglobus sp.]